MGFLLILVIMIQVLILDTDASLGSAGLTWILSSRSVFHLTTLFLFILSPDRSSNPNPYSGPKPAVAEPGDAVNALSDVSSPILQIELVRMKVFLNKDGQVS